MIVTIATALVFVEIKNAAFLKTLSNAMLSLWLKWELRAMVVLSLTVQLILIGFGNRRTFTGKKRKLISFLVWTLYLFADWLATVALSTLLRSKNEQITSPLFLFWTPFLLLHLGGPDTITAYSLSDNELWLRHMFGLCFQIGVALYVYVKFWTLTVTKLNLMAIPIFIVGIFKYGERVCALNHARSDQLRESVFSSPVAKELETDLLQQKENSIENVELEKYLESKRIEENYRYLHRASLFFQVFRPMFSDLKLRIYKDLEKIFNMDSKVTAQEAFRTVEIELGFLYDLLFTKIPIVLTKKGVILRSICLSLTTSTLIAFMFVVGKHGFRKVDIGISYLLMVGAIFLELYSAILHLSSDRGILWLTTQNCSPVLKVICSKLYYLNNCRRKEGIRTMAQHNLLDYCLKPRKIKFYAYAVLKLIDEDDNLEKYFHTSWKNVKTEFQDLIYDHLKKKRLEYGNEENKFEYRKLSEILDRRGKDVILERGSAIYQEIAWTITEAEFTHSIILWHIATEVVYRDDTHRFRAGNLSHYCETSKLISDYMMYLLFLCPAMLPEGIGNIRHNDSCEEAEKFFLKKSKINISAKESIRGLFGIDLESRSFFIQMGSRRKSAFFEGCEIAAKLQTLVPEFQWEHYEKWQMIADIWLDMLTYAAAQCSWKEHARQLQQGEELLTHVALLMAHLGLTKKISLEDMSARLTEAHFQPSWSWENLDRLAYYLA